MLQKVSPSLGGGEALFYNFARSMQSKGHEVHILCYELRASKDHSVTRPGLEIHNLLDKGVIMHTIKPSIEDRGGVLFSYKHQIGYIVNALRRGRQIIKKNKIDIVHANSYTPIIPAVILGKILRVPVVSTIHHVTLDQWKVWASQEGVQGTTSFIGPIYEKLILRMPVQIVHLVSHSTKEDFIKINPKAKVAVIYNGIDLGRNVHLCTEYRYQEFILYIGRLASTKNLSVVILAFRYVIQTLPHAKLVVVGEGPMRKEWEQLVRENGLDRNVIFMGHVSSDHKEELLQACSAVVLPSLLEGFGRVIIEAFAMCKPVLVSNIRAIAEIVDDSIDGFLIPPSDVELWAEKVKFLLSNKEECRIMGTNGKKKVLNRFSLSLISDEMEELYGYVICEKKSKD
jgi:glycosyltransferase involved in cell wall biosynthesis